jgi:GT2 family glycosyltransferase
MALDWAIACLSSYILVISNMAVHVIIPVFNRLKLTQKLVTCLRKQKLNQSLHLIVVNDGSTDGTTEWLATQKDIESLNGDGSLFWGGAVDLAMRHLKFKAAPEDWVLLINNDTTIAEDFVQRLLDIGFANAPAAVGSVIRNEADRAHLLSIGASVDAWRLLTCDLLDIDKSKAQDSVVEVDALSGRGVLFPLAALLAAGGMRPRLLPHYLADYEVSVRVRKCGWRLLVSTEAAVYSDDDYGNRRHITSWHERLFSIRSPFYLPALLTFWWEMSSWSQRLTLPVRLPLFYFFPSLRKSPI